MGCLSSDVWVGELEKSTSKLSTSDAAKKSATAVLEVRMLAKTLPKRVLQM